MKPGRGLDQLIAEKVMGHKILVNQSLYPDGLGEQCGSVYGPLGHYSADIAAAWEVVLEMAKRGHPVEIYAGGSGDGSSWTVTFFGGSCGNEYADTAPLAICLAALKAAAREN